MSSKIRNLINSFYNGNYEAGRKAAMLPEATATNLEELSHSPQPETRVAVAANSNTSTETLARLVYDPDIRVAAAVAARQSISREFIDILTLRAAADYTALRGRERAHVLDLAVALADNETMSIFDVENLLKKIQTSHLPRLLAEKTTKKSLLEYFAIFPKETVRLECLKNPHLDREVIELLKNDSSPKVSEKAAELYIEKFPEEVTISTEELNRKHDSFQRELLPELDQIKSNLGIALLNGIITENIGSISSLLDYGCQNNTNIKELQKLNAGISCYAYCINQPCIDECSKKITNYKVIQQLEELLPENATFDCILLTDFFQFKNPVSLYLPEVLNLLNNNGIFKGTFLCTESENEYAYIFNNIAEDYGYYFEESNEALMNIATCGLVIQNISEFKPLAAITSANSPVSEKTLWGEIINDFIAEVEEKPNNIIGYIEVEGRKIDLK